VPVKSALTQGFAIPEPTELIGFTDGGFTQVSLAISRINGDVHTFETGVSGVKQVLRELKSWLDLKAVVQASVLTLVLFAAGTLSTS
jgi:hypothetical protein